jgi:hypothetical protein
MKVLVDQPRDDNPVLEPIRHDMVRPYRLDDFLERTDGDESAPTHGDCFGRGLNLIHRDDPTCAVDDCFGHDPMLVSCPV